MPLILIASGAKLLVSVALTVRTRLWWLPSIAVIAAGVALARIASPGLGTAGIALGAAALATTRVVRARAHFAQSTSAHRF